MKTFRIVIIVLLISVTCALTFSCNKEDSKFGPPVKKSIPPAERDRSGWITQKDLDTWNKEVPDSNGNMVLTMEELRGMKLFMKKCNRCHPAGEKGKGPSLNDKKLPDFLIHFQIKNGFGDMPAFTEKDLSKEDVKRIILFVKLIRKNEKS